MNYTYNNILVYNTDYENVVEHELIHSLLVNLPNDKFPSFIIEGITELINDEYQDKNDFWEMALTWEQEDGFDSASYEEYNKREGGYHQYPITGELTDLLIDNGYKFTSYSNSDFYSDGLRFAGFTEFC